MQDLSYLIIGGDKRQEYIYKNLISKNKSADIIYKSVDGKISYDTEKIKSADIIILPTPLTKDGKTVFCERDKGLEISEITSALKDNAVIFSGGSHPLIDSCTAKKSINILKDEIMTLKNAMATAEATLKILIEKTDYTLHGSKIVLLGFGRIGKFLSHYLKALGADTVIIARKPEVRTEAELNGFKTGEFINLSSTIAKADIVINTVPFLVLDKEALKNMKKSALIIDLASKPGGVDFKAAEELEIKAIHALSLPGKYSPKSAADYILAVIENTVNQLKKEG